MDTTHRPNLSELLKELPPWVSRKHPRFKELTGYSPRSLANFDSLGMTKAIKKIKMAGAIAYQRESLVAWLEERSQVME
jgi:hypothetical protein